MFLLIPFCFIQTLLAAEISKDTNLEHLEKYIQQLVDSQIEKKVESGELVRRKELEDLNTRLEAEKRIKDVQQYESRLDSVYEYKHSGIFGSKRYLSDSALTPFVGFTACVNVPDLVSLGNKHTILFDRAITNVGGAYHSHTGVFIAPLKGLYVFHLSAMSSPNKAQYLSIVKDGTVINHVYPDGIGTQTFQTAGNQWVLELDQGSEVWIQTYMAGEIHGNCFTVFSGFLLTEME